MVVVVVDAIHHGAIKLGEGARRQLGSGRRKRTHVIDIVMLQSIAHRAADPTLLNRYGLIIVDECHSLGAAATEAAVRQIAVRHWVGLTATPYRADQMDDIITMQCGPIRHTIDDSAVFEQELVVHKTTFRSSAADAPSTEIQAVYTELSDDVERNQRIAADVLAAYRAGRNCLVLSTRVEHVARLAELLKTETAAVFVLHGKLAARNGAGSAPRCPKLQLGLCVVSSIIVALTPSSRGWQGMPCWI
ncbi:DEAD/DEAH box helicase [Cryobacterium sp. SO1]|uniref:DEAD/DEAH box helicase n=1 Tax=Cryobacterium sp. SO1 TaxID=1897061 RepID=UPI00210A1945|nr:DEAD/DEAH box helicase family protein [Cryobacterium sp. SO1]